MKIQGVYAYNKYNSFIFRYESHNLQRMGKEKKSNSLIFRMDKGKQFLWLQIVCKYFQAEMESE